MKRQVGVRFEDRESSYSAENSLDRVGAGEQVAQGPSSPQRQPDPPPMLGPVVQQMAALAECFDVAMPSPAMGRVMVEMGRRQHDLGRPHRRILGQGR